MPTLVVWLVECWHSGDSDEGHNYQIVAQSPLQVVPLLQVLLVREGVDPNTVTFLQIASSR